MRKRKPCVAVLGAGIMGSSLSLFLARKGAAVTLFDAADSAMAAASRWNEGKIHLGYIYSADKSLRTAEHVMPGGLMFRPLLEELIDCSIEAVVTARDDIYLCHRESVVAPDAMEAHLREVTRRLREHPDAAHYLSDAGNARVERLRGDELDLVSGSADILAGFRVPERSVETGWIADRLAAAVVAEPKIRFLSNTRVQAVKALSGFDAVRWEIETPAGHFAPFDIVVNALWQGRLAIDRTVGLPPPGVWSHRYRRSLFVRTKRPVDVPCAIIATGPFGDVKNYNGRDFYLSWYPAGLCVDTSAVSPPEAGSLVLPAADDFKQAVFDHLSGYLPWVEKIREQAERVVIGGGWVFAAGRGQLSDPASTLHSRFDYGVAGQGGYFSVDTGKYSTAPWMAKTLADRLIS
jgi:glycine/D-amino acid oxidase-like deaminating enzyme